MYYGNQVGVSGNRNQNLLSPYLQTTTSPQQSMYTFGPAVNLQNAPGPGGVNHNLQNWYSQTLPYYQSGGSPNFGPTNAIGQNAQQQQWNHVMSTLYGNRPNPWDMGGSGSGGNGGGGNSGGGGGGNNSNAGGMDQVTSTIQARPIYSPESIQRNTNQQVARAFEAADSRGLQERFAGRGRSLDAGTESAVLPAMATAETAAAQAMVGSPLQDWYANQANILQGQTGAANESLGLASILDQIRGSQQQAQLGMLWPLLSMAGM